MPNQQAHSRDRVRRIAELAETKPGTALGHLTELPPFLVSEDVETRKLATEAFTNLSRHYPGELRPVVDVILARLDDADSQVRTNLLYTVSYLARWYPQDFHSGTALMVESLQAPGKKERLAAATAVATIAYYRPDIVTPREEALTLLQSLRDEEDIDDDAGFLADSEILEGAIGGLKGGDMASRPLEDDLLPIGKKSNLSKPARVAITSALWIPLAMVTYFLIPYRAFHFLRRSRVRFRSSIADVLVFTLVTTIGYLKHVALLYPLRRAQLYLRRSAIATPSGLVPWFPGKTPVTADHYAEVPDYPEDWEICARYVRQRDDYECRNCSAVGGPRDGSAELHVDHQIPRSKGGEDHPRNLRTLCKECHEARHGRKFSNA